MKVESVLDQGIPSTSLAINVPIYQSNFNVFSLSYEVVWTKIRIQHPNPIQRSVVIKSESQSNFTKIRLELLSLIVEDLRVSFNDLCTS